MKAHFEETVPDDLDKSTLVDGRNRLRAYYRVVLPVSGPGLVASGAFTFLLCWSEFMVAQVLITKPGATTLPPVMPGWTDRSTTGGQHGLRLSARSVLCCWA